MTSASISNHTGNLRMLQVGVSALLLFYFLPVAAFAEPSWTLESPSARLKVKIEQQDGIRYSVSLHNDPIIARRRST